MSDKSLLVHSAYFQRQNFQNGHGRSPTQMELSEFAHLRINSKKEKPKIRKTNILGGAYRVLLRHHALLGIFHIHITPFNLHHNTMGGGGSFHFRDYVTRHTDLNISPKATQKKGSQSGSKHLTPHSLFLPLLCLNNSDMQHVA